MKKTNKVIIVNPKKDYDGDKVRPAVIPWKEVHMIRNHSIRASVREIVNVSNSLDLVKVGIIGNQSTGKSETAKTIAHLFHKMSKLPFTVRIFEKEELLNFEQTLKRLTPANYVLVFDDVSFLGASASKRQVEMVKQAITVIRHLPGGQDVKIVIIMNYHYTLGLDKYLRQSDFKYFTSVGSSEMDNMEKIVGNKYMELCKNFQIMYTRMLGMVGQKRFTFMLGKEPFSYTYRDPFIPLLFFNNDTLRVVVSPLRTWIDKLCPICDISDQSSQSEISIAQFCKEAEEKLGAGAWKTAIKHRLLMNGMNVYGPSVVQAGRYFDRAAEKKQIKLEDVAKHYNLSITKTRLDKALDGVLSSEPSPA